MKKQLNEVKRLQKIAAIISENSMGNDPEQQIAQDIYDDLLGERTAMELAEMTTEEALETIEAMGIPQRIAKYLSQIAQNPSM